MRLYQISVVLLVTVLLGMAVPAMAGVPQQAPGSVPNMCDPTTGGPCIIADFIASPITGDAPLRVQFLDTSSGRPSMWSWDFGDGSNRSSIADPVHIYTKPGKYTVTLVASSTTGGTSTKVKEAYIIVTDPTPIYADFVASPTWGKAPLEVAFSDCTIGNPTSWLWDFGDGYTDTVQNPIHIYKKPGKYTVTLTASTELGKSSTKVKEKYITVEGECQIIADFVFEPQTGSAPLTVRFQDRSTGSPTMWSWDFGDGPIPMEEEISCSGDGCSNIANPVHTYTQPGTYTIRLTASSETCMPGTTEKTITVSPPRMDVDFVGAPTTGRAPLMVTFTDLTIGDPTMWAWEFGDGATDMVASPTHTYSEPGVYSVRLAASNQMGGSGEMLKERYITVDPACDIVADFSASPTTGSAPLTVKFTDLSTGHPTMWHWDFGDGVIPMESCSGDGCDNIANPTHTYLEPGEYTVTLTASDQYGCSDTVTKKEFVVVVPACDIKADFRADPQTGTAPLTVRFTDLSTGNPTMWYWDFGDGAVPMEENASCSGDGCSNVANPIHTYLEPGEYTVTLTASDQYGCSDTVTKQQYVVVVPACDIKADFIADPTTGSAPLTVKFTDKSTGSPTMWHWDFGDGVIPMESCSGDGCDNIANPVHTYLEPGTYTVTLTASDQYGCSDTVTKKEFVVVVPACDINADFSAEPTTGSSPLKVQFTDRSTGGATMWKWDFGDGAMPMDVACSGGGCDNIANPYHTYLDPGTYTVTLTASNQYGCSDTETKKDFIVVVQACNINADFIADPLSGDAPLKVQFTDTSTGGATMWKWDFGDDVMPMDVACSGGGCDNIANPYHTYLDPGTYTVTLTASNQYGCSDTETKKNYITVGAGSDGDIPLSAGWNFVSVPRKLEPGKDTGAIISHIDVKGHSVFQYDESKHVWNIMNSASPIRPLEAFWIYSAKADAIPVTFDKNPVQTPPTRTLKKGWNGIGFTGLTPIEAKYTLLSVQNQWVNCIGYNAGAQRYHDMIIKGSNDQTLMEPYMGYWLYMNAEGILAANAA